VASKGIYLGAPGEGDWSNFGGFGDGTLDTTVIAFGECSLQEILALPVAEHDPGDPEAGGSRAEWYANRVWGTIEATCTGLDTDTDNDDTRDTGDTGDGGDT
jgi:hypothetical protein